MEEREVTLTLKDNLSKRNWRILSVHFPGAQGGLSISIGKSKRIVPDLLAMKEKVVLIIESKPGYFPNDVEKLNEMFDNPEYFRILERKLSLPKSLVYQKAIAFHSQNFDESDIPSGFIVFVVEKKGEVKTYLNNNVCSLVKNILP